DLGTAVVALHDLRVLEHPGQVDDAALHLPLLLLGGVVVAVLGEVAELAGGLDLASDVEPAPRREVLVLGLESVKGRLGEVDGVSHPARLSTPPGRQHTSIGRLASPEWVDPSCPTRAGPAYTC